MLEAATHGMSCGEMMRTAVNSWLGSSRLKTPYKLVVRSLVALDQMGATLEAGLDRLQDEGLEMEHEGETRSDCRLVARDQRCRG